MYCSETESKNLILNEVQTGEVPSIKAPPPATPTPSVTRISTVAPPVTEVVTKDHNNYHHPPNHNHNHMQHQQPPQQMQNVEFEQYDHYNGQYMSGHTTNLQQNMIGPVDFNSDQGFYDQFYGYDANDGSNSLRPYSASSNSCSSTESDHNNHIPNLHAVSIQSLSNHDRSPNQRINNVFEPLGNQHFNNIQGFTNTQTLHVPPHESPLFEYKTNETQYPSVIVEPNQPNNYLH